MKVVYQRVLKFFIWMLILGLLFMGLNYLVQPIWFDWNNYDTVHGFYKEPEDRIQVIFLGASATINAITPMELYEDYGICAYNLATEQQPMLASYYWLEEAYRKHPQTLKTVVLDVSALRKPRNLAFCRKAIDGMEWSLVKYNAVKAYSGVSGSTIANLMPLYNYHDRWNEIGQTDFQKNNYSVNTSARGYHFSTDKYLDSSNILQVPIYMIDDDVEETIFDEEAVKYFEDIIEFCENKELNLTLVKMSPWTSSHHKAVEKMASVYELDFLDFSFDPLFSEIGYNLATDTVDSMHPNYYGAEKLTQYMGNYLKSKYQFQDVRKDEKYSYMKKQLDEYCVLVKNAVKMREIVDPKEYLRLAASNNDYTIFIVIKEDAARSLTQEQREGFLTMGLTKLSSVAVGEPYLAVFDRGRLICEKAGYSDMTEKVSEEISLFDRGILNGRYEYSLESVKKSTGNKASCVINGIEYAKNHRGLNFVVYDNKLGRVIDTAYFDTSLSDVRDGGNLADVLNNAEKSGQSYSEFSENIQKLFLYNRSCENARTSQYLKQNLAEDGLLNYLSVYWKEDYIIYLSVMDEAAGIMDISVRTSLVEYGLNELSELGYGDSYLGVVNGGQVVYEQKDHGNEPITTRYISHILKSGGCESGDIHSSIVIDGVEYSPNTKGINIVVYDTLTKTVVDTAVFDTCMNPMKVSE